MVTIVVVVVVVVVVVLLLCFCFALLRGLTEYKALESSAVVVVADARIKKLCGDVVLFSND